MRDREGRDGGAHPFGRGDAARERRRRQDRDELLAAVAREAVTRALQRRGRGVRRTAQRVVARGVAVAVVVDLEVVEVQDRDDQRGALARGAQPLLGQAGVEGAAVGDPGQAVGLRRLRQKPRFEREREHQREIVGDARVARGEQDRVDLAFAERDLGDALAQVAGLAAHRAAVAPYHQRDPARAELLAQLDGRRCEGVGERLRSAQELRDPPSGGSGQHRYRNETGARIGSSATTRLRPVDFATYSARVGAPHAARRRRRRGPARASRRRC